MSTSKTSSAGEPPKEKPEVDQKVINEAQVVTNTKQRATNTRQRTKNVAQSVTNAEQVDTNAEQDVTNTKQRTKNDGQGATNAAQNSTNSRQKAANASQEKTNADQDATNVEAAEKLSAVEKMMAQSQHNVAVISDAMSSVLAGQAEIKDLYEEVNAKGDKRAKIFRKLWILVLVIAFLLSTAVYLVVARVQEQACVARSASTALTTELVQEYYDITKANTPNSPYLGVERIYLDKRAATNVNCNFYFLGQIHAP